MADVEEPRWIQRFRAVRVSLPQWAEDEPSRCLFVSNPTGTFELYTWDRATDERRQATRRPNGTAYGTLDRAGEQLWWFDDTDGDEFGVWRRQPFGADVTAGDVEAEAATPLEASYPAGLALGRRIVVVGRATDDGSSIHLLRPGAVPITVYENTEDAHLGALSDDDSLIAIGHSEHGDSRHMAVRVLDAVTGSAVAELWDGPGKGLEILGFAPVPGDTRLLVQHERHEQPALLLWDVADGAETELAIDLPGEIEADWYPDGRSLLVRHDIRARSELYRYDLATSTVHRLPAPRGTIGSATARPDGAVEFTWSSSAEPGVVRDLAGAVVLTPPGPRAPAARPVEDVDVDGPAGPVHALLSLPATGEGPYPTVFIVHGGPTAHDTDSFASDRGAYTDLGFAVVNVNYRGSTGYGNVWRDSIEGRPGLTELEDVTAVREALVARGVTDPTRVAITGASWGGYLTLLGIGTEPGVWTAAVAGVPVADYVAAYEDEMEPLRAFDRSLFGGSPEEVPEIYRASSPLTYVDAVTTPVLVVAGENDPRCPIRQIDNYLAALDARGATHEVYRYDAGHGSLVVEERIVQMRLELEFVARHLAPEALALLG
jgi:dienelactone hydrolase